METSLLTTKLKIPPARPQTIFRPRLMERLQEGLSYNLILVSAPAGFGKTTLLSEWLRQNQSSLRATWLSLDEGDNDPTRFWGYFIEALRVLQPSCGETALALLHTDKRFTGKAPPIDSVLNALINDIASIPGDFVVVLDDFHLIELKQIHEGIIYLLEHIPAQMHLAMATRADPALPLARFRAGRTMLEIGSDDLRFTTDDVVSLLKELKAPEISVEDTVALNERAEGWVAGLIMAILSMRGRKDVTGFIADFTGSQRYVVDYLMAEVLQKQTPEITDFLLKTSVLERLTGSLCEAVTGHKGNKDILLNLERDHLFITPLDDIRQWYRYEHLFRDILRHRLEAEHGKEAVGELHRKASRWYEANGNEDEAIEHALAAQDWETAARLLEHAVPRKEQSGEWTTVLGWMQALPGNILLAHPYVYCQYGKFMQLSGQIKAAEAVLSDLDSIARQDTRLSGKVAALRMLIAKSQEDNLQALEYGREALSLLPEEEVEERGFVLCNLGMVQFAGGAFNEAEKLLTEALRAGRKAGANITIGYSIVFLAAILHYKGRLHEAFELCQEAERITNQSAINGYLGIIHYEWNDLKAALSELEQAEELGRYLNDAGRQQWIYNQLASTRFALGDTRGALETLGKIASLKWDSRIRLPWEAQTVSLYVKIALQQGNLKEAIEWGKKLPVSAIGMSVEAKYLLLLARGRKKEVVENLQRIDKITPPDWNTPRIILYILHALAADSAEEAVDFLSEALTLAEPEGFIRTIVDYGKQLLPILEEALTKGITPEYTRKLITFIEAEERQRRIREKSKEAPSPHQTILSERELEVLKLMAEGLSNQQIADRCIISLSTAKNHVHNIIDKLESKGRTQAIALARELKLI